MTARALAAAWLAMAACAAAQQVTLPPPQFAPPNLTPAGVRAMAAACASCHGTEGYAAPGSAIPGLAARPRGSIAQAMGQFASGRKPATVMQQIARGFSAEEAQAMDDYFSRQPRPDGAPR